MNTRILIAAVVVSMFVCQQVHAQAEDDPVMPEATELEGTWKIVSWVVAGEQIEKDNHFWRFEGNTTCFRYVYYKDWQQYGTFSMDPLAMPAEIDFEVTDPELTVRAGGIYEIDGDLLRICFDYSTGFEPLSRPDRFESLVDSKTILCAFRRVTEEDEDYPRDIQIEDDPVETEKTEVEGIWNLVSFVVNGEQEDTDGFWRFEGNRMYSRLDSDEKWMSLETFSVEPSAIPAEIDLFVWRGIYKLEGDLLTICIGNPRPDEFDSSKALYVFRRVTEENDE